ncbi:MAG: tRNA preQ1(34) S-adenosylmethionine ribosyltransferase-isomerase QueA [Gammaproteobacteria bacterium]|nr:tRNA preQ1(34) S-adenosylmethionine ribosyltransferase-isomerase QueA [Gammaproteobacteria bacterium]
MRTDEFDYQLPPERIAQTPAAQRSDARLLVLPASGPPRDARFPDLAGLLRPGDLLVLNNTRVIPARLRGHKASGGRVELLLERLLGEGRVLAQLRASKSPAAGVRLQFPGGVEAEVRGRHGEFYEIDFGTSLPVERILESVGEVPLPPYIERVAGETDRERYQTVYARHPGAVAAPTAGLHFDREFLASLAAHGVEQAWVTLHVGAGTFSPVRSEDIEDHHLHAEFREVPVATVAAVERTRARGGRVVAVGTTSVRSLESSLDANGRLTASRGETDCFLVPGHDFLCVDALITNFHLPRSTLLMLVAALAGRERVLAAYQHAVAAGYRFFSYGDAMWVERHR